MQTIFSRVEMESAADLTNSKDFRNIGAAPTNPVFSFILTLLGSGLEWFLRFVPVRVQ